MKTFIKSLAIALSLGTGVASAQIDSPHNYKRPVVYKKPTAQLGVVIPLTNTPNSIVSANNYKRQNMQNTVLGSSIAINAPSLQAPAFNPLLLPNHYKIHARPYTGTAEYAQEQRVRYQIQKPDSLGK